MPESLKLLPIKDRKKFIKNAFREFFLEKKIPVTVNETYLVLENFNVKILEDFNVYRINKLKEFIKNEYGDDYKNYYRSIEWYRIEMQKNNVARITW